LRLRLDVALLAGDLGLDGELAVLDVALERRRARLGAGGRLRRRQRPLGLHLLDEVAVRVVGPRLELLGTARVQLHVGRVDLQVGGLAVGRALLARRGPWLALAALLADADDLVAGGEVDAAARDGGAAVDLHVGEAVGRGEEELVQVLALLGARLEDVEAGVDLADVDLAVAPDRRAAGVPAVAVLPELLAGLGVEAVELGDVVGDVEPALVDDRRGVARLDAVLLPDELGLLVLHLRAIHADDTALDGVVGVPLALADVDEVA